MTKQRLPSGAGGQWAVWEGRHDFNKNGDVMCLSVALKHLNNYCYYTTIK